MSTCPAIAEMKDGEDYSPVVTALSFVISAIGMYFLWPVAGPAAAVGAMMKAPGAGGLLICRAAFQANPQLYFTLLRTAGAAAAAAAFAACA